ncbi:sugar transferase, partial [Candidatus Kuenenbacteria bacterium CG23_combo_of_CG06-09_8_20_14_all_39_39]
LKAFDLFVLPSVKEGLVYTLIEAEAAALPIIATNVGGNPEIIAHNKN